MRTKTVCVILLLGFIGVGPAMADIMVGFNPVDQRVDLAVTQVAFVDIVADIPEADGIVGWGLDLDFDATLLGTATVTIGPAFNPFPAPDGDALAGLVPFMDIPLWGDDIVLATIQFDLVGEGAYGISPLILSDGYPPDITEGFALPGIGEFAVVQYADGSINVVPSPSAATLGLLGLFSLGLARRRR